VIDQNDQEEVAAAFAALRLFFRAIVSGNHRVDDDFRVSPWGRMALLEAAGECDENDLEPPAHPWQYEAYVGAGSTLKSGLDR
jgi:hypothetical protein